jgi:hypothetical protein
MVRQYYINLIVAICPREKFRVINACNWAYINLKKVHKHMATC